MLHALASVGVERRHIVSCLRFVQVRQVCEVTPGGLRFRINSCSCLRMCLDFCLTVHSTSLASLFWSSDVGSCRTVVVDGLQRFFRLTFHRSSTSSSFVNIRTWKTLAWLSHSCTFTRCVIAEAASVRSIFQRSFPRSTSNNANLAPMFLFPGRPLSVHFNFFVVASEVTL